MKRIIVGIAVSIICMGLFAQTRHVKEPTDTIIKINKLVMPVNVTTVTPSYVSFVYPGNSEVYTIERKDVYKIIYKNGKNEVLNPPAYIDIPENAWEAVWLTENKKDVVNLYMLGEIEATSPPNTRSSKAAKKGAIIKLQKKAANLRGSVILVTYKELRGGYGENQGYLIKGIAYGYDPPEENPDTVQNP